MRSGDNNREGSSKRWREISAEASWSPIECSLEQTKLDRYGYLASASREVRVQVNLLLPARGLPIELQPSSGASHRR